MQRHHRSRNQAIYSMAWDAMGSVRASRDRLPFSTQLLTYLLSDNSGATKEAFHFGQWLATLESECLAHLCDLGFEIAASARTPTEMEARADLVLLLEMAIFEERVADLTIEVSETGGVKMIEHLGVCAGLELMRRNQWAAINFISVDAANIQAILTPGGMRAKADVFAPSLLRAFDWVAEKGQRTALHQH